MTHGRWSTPVWALEGDPCEAGGRAGIARLLFAMIRRDTLATVSAFRPDALTTAGHLTWTAHAPDGHDRQVGEVRDSHVRWAERGVGLALLQAAQELAAVQAWLGAAVPDSRRDESWLNSSSATAGQHPFPAIDLSDRPSTEIAAAGAEVYLAFHRAGRATIAAFATDSLVWVGHLVWTISRPGGRLGGEQAGRSVGEVQRVDTRDGYRKQGIATGMYHAALQAAASQGWPTEIDHNPSRTPRGDAWAGKVGGWLPPLTNGRHMPESDDLIRMLEARRPAPQRPAAPG